MRLFTASAVLAASSALALAGGPTLDTGSRKQLFIDYRFIDSAEGVTLTMNPPVRTGEIVLKPDAPWESDMITGSYCSVIQEGGKIRLWYNVLGTKAEPRQNPDFMGVAYAESTDGIHFTKPKLGLVEYQGSRQNNIVFPPDLSKLSSGGGSVWIDENPNCPPAERYKSWQKVYPKKGTGLRGPHRFFVSPDGLHWKLHEETMTGLRAADTQSTWFWDARLKRYLGYTREWVRFADGRPVRMASYNESDDMIHWRNMQIVLAPDETDYAADVRPLVDARTMKVVRERWVPLSVKETAEDKPVSNVPFADDVPIPGAPLDIYGPGIFPYREADGVYLSLMSVFHHWDKESRDSWPDTGDVRLAVSRDARHFTNPGKREAFLRLGPAGSFDSRWIWAFPQPVRMGDELWIYYYGTNHDHARRVDPAAPNGKELTGLSRAVMRLDGFVSADFDYGGGELVTPPLRFTGSKLELNIDTGGGGVARVEIFDADGTPIDGFKLSDADQINTNSTHAVVSWQGKSDLAKLAGREVRLRIKARATKVYAFQFR